MWYSCEDAGEGCQLPEVEGVLGRKGRLGWLAARCLNALMTVPLLYLVACRSPSTAYVKIGRTANLYRRLANIQTGCPHRITDVFAILSQYDEEVEGLERLMHRLLQSIRLRGEWYEGSDAFFAALDETLVWINGGDRAFEDLQEIADMVSMSELEIILHGHEFQFRRVPLPLRASTSILDVSVEVQPEQIAVTLAGFAILAREDTAEYDESLDRY
jgi:Meiotically up-regulated gene 113